MITPEILKKILIQIKNNNYRVPDDKDAFELALAMTEHIGHIDPELRDKLIYGTFYNWIFNGVFTSEKLSKLLNICMDKEHMFYRIGEIETDSVFTRTFSILIIPLVLYIDQQSAFLTEVEIHNVKDKVIEYMEWEKDLRGYVEGKGWADARAHAADAIDDIAKSVYIGHTDLLDLLTAIRKKASTADYSCASNEDERMASAVMSILKRKILLVDEILCWIKSFEFTEKKGIYIYDFYAKINAKHFLRCVYFNLLNQNYPKIYIEAVKNTLELI